MIRPDLAKQYVTWREIMAQPRLWSHWAKAFDVAQLRNWLHSLAFDEVWFCGAGTSAFIGDILVAGLGDQSIWPLRSIPSTDLVARPKHFLNGSKQPLVVNFGRSGNSAESLGTLDALEVLAPKAPRLNITCNPDGALATRKSEGPHYTIVLPEETHDAGFAMTSSFTTMFLTALSIFDPKFDMIKGAAVLSEAFEQALPAMVKFAHASTPDRVVFLGAGALSYAAREAALKTLELSAGQIPVLWDSPLGFRHGPKSFVTDETLIVIFLSCEAHARLYDLDLVSELDSQFPNSHILTVGEAGMINLTGLSSDLEQAILCVAFAQVASVLWSDQLGMAVDNPFEGQGTLTRVVADVRLHGVRS